MVYLFVTALKLDILLSKLVSKVINLIEQVVLTGGGLCTIGIHFCIVLCTISGQVLLKFVIEADIPFPP